MPQPLEPDTKDWTWVIDRACPECGFDPHAQSLADVPRLLHDTAMVFSQVLRRPGVRERPAPETWSPLEYACHVRDVHRIFGERVELILSQDVPVFANWDQDQAAIDAAYADQDPAVVDLDLIEAAGHVAGLYSTVTPQTAGRRGLRSNGSEFTLETLGLYHLHDVVHHVHDVGA
ncbi:DinB family protein [Nocardioides piscis]|uniref:DinB family protein n=1 Tax=Nocardioides piscis TaxID=2714938 RepID=UPI001982119F|nr:DinB family protein [Nocardioides piscis]